MTNVVATDLEAAADVIEARGWWPGPTRMLNTDGHACLVMAVAHAIRSRYGVRDLYAIEKSIVDLHQANQTVAGFLGVLSEGLAEWNDQQLDGEFVVAMLRKCAAELRAQEEA